MIDENQLGPRLAASLDRQSDMAQLIQRLFVRLEEQGTLLQSALHELAECKKQPKESHAHFINEWFSKRRKDYM